MTINCACGRRPLCCPMQTNRLRLLRAVAIPDPSNQSAGSNQTVTPFNFRARPPPKTAQFELGRFVFFLRLLIGCSGIVLFMIVVLQFSADSNSCICTGIGRGHTDSVDSIASAPNTNQFVSASWDGKLMVWQPPADPSQNQKKRKGQSGATAAQELVRAFAFGFFFFFFFFFFDLWLVFIFRFCLVSDSRHHTRRSLEFRNRGLLARRVGGVFWLSRSYRQAMGSAVCPVRSHLARQASCHCD
jgi:hypothetical protein